MFWVHEIDNNIRIMSSDSMNASLIYIHGKILLIRFTIVGDNDKARSERTIERDHALVRIQKRLQAWTVERHKKPADQWQCNYRAMYRNVWRYQKRRCSLLWKIATGYKKCIPYVWACGISKYIFIYFVLMIFTDEKTSRIHRRPNYEWVALLLWYDARVYTTFQVISG